MPIEFKLHELMEAKGLGPGHQTESRVYFQCPFTDHDTPGRHGTFQVYREGKNGGSHGGYVCPCGEKGSAWDFVSRYWALPEYGSADFGRTIEFVCDALGIEAPEKKDNAKTRSIEVWRALDKRLRPISKGLDHPHFEDGRYRGLSPMTWHAAGVGVFTSDAIEEIQDRFSKDRLEEAGLFSWKGTGIGWIGQGVAIMRKGRYGAPMGVAVRRYDALCKYKADPKYLKSGAHAALDTSSEIFGLHAARRKKDPRVLWVVEGEMDALALRLRGHAPAVAMGGYLSDGRTESLSKLGGEVRYLTDAGEAGDGIGAQVARRFPEATFSRVPGGDPEDYLRSGGNPEDLEVLTALELEAIAEKTFGDPELNRYLKRLAKNPTARDENAVKTLARLSGREESYLKSALFGMRIQMAENDSLFSFF